MLLGAAPRRFFYGEQPPPEPYAEHVLALWSFDVRLPAGEVALHTIWPDGCVSLSVVCSAGSPVAASVVGPCMRALRIPMRSGLTVRGLRLWPDTAAHVLGVDPAAIRDTARPAAEVLGVGALSLARTVARATDDAATGTVWEEWLAPRIASAALPDPDVRFLVRLLIDSDGAHDLGAAARLAGVGLRQLERRFGAAVGLSPRQFARVRRVRATIGSIVAGERGPSQLAAQVGLELTALKREFRSVSGLTPEQFMEQLDQMETGDMEEANS